MSTITNVVDTTNMLATNYDVSKFLLGFNDFIKADCVGGTGGTVLTEGMVMGRIASTLKIVPLDKDAVDGSQYPVGCVVQAQTVGDGVTKSIVLVNKGRIASAKVTFADTETLDTLIVLALSSTGGTPASSVHSKSVGDLLNQLGLILMGGEELTAFDNS
jgi:hypothetical protein